MMKICSTCNKSLPLCDFTKQASSKDGLDYVCRECKKIAKKNNSRSKKGLVSAIYSEQKSSSKDRGHRLPEYTKQELKDWLYSQFEFHEIYSEWVASDYSKRLRPSIDRKNDYIHYCFSNIQLMTWGENFDKGHSDRKNGVNNKHNKEVSQYTLDGEFIATYHSLHEAARVVGISVSVISATCKGRQKTAGGFKWQ